MVTEFIPGGLIKGEFFRVYTRGYIGDPVIGQQPFKINQVDRFIGKHMVGGQQRGFI